MIAAVIGEGEEVATEMEGRGLQEEAVGRQVETEEKEMVRMKKGEEETATDKEERM